MRYDWFKLFSINQFDWVLRLSQISISISIRTAFGNWFVYNYVLYVNDTYEIRFCSANFFQNLCFQDQDQDHEQDQDFTMKFIGTSHSLYTKDIHQIWCRSAKFLWKSKFCSGSGFGSGSWFYFGFQYQTYISYIEDTHHILFGFANSFESYCVHMKSPRTYVQPGRQTDRRTFFCLFCLLRYTNHQHSSKREIFFSLMRLQDFLFLHTPYVMRKQKQRYRRDRIYLSIFLLLVSLSCCVARYRKRKLTWDKC